MLERAGLALTLSLLAFRADAAPGDMVQHFNTSGEETEQAPGTADLLGDRLKSYQSAKNCGGILGLFYTEGMDDDRKTAFETTIRDNMCEHFDRPIASVAFQSVNPEKLKEPIDFNGKHSVYTLDPQGVIVIDYGEGKPGETRSLSFFYGVHDKGTYLITTKNADAK